MMRQRKHKGFTLIEVLAAVMILGVIIVPMIIYMGDALKSNLSLERRVHSALLAQGELEKIQTALYNSYTTDFSGWSIVLSGNYLVTRTFSDPSSSLKKTVVSVGYDEDLNGTLASGEVMVTLNTLFVKRT